MVKKKKSSVGRPSLGITQKVSLTLTPKEWESLNMLQLSSNSESRSDLLRKIIRNVINPNGELN